jgi:uncharacterized phage-like protein YoqJ
MNEILINKNITCAVTGHRNIQDKIDTEKLKNIFIDLIEKDYKYFLIGMAVGFDMLCFETLYSLKSDYNIKLIACVPCPNQSRNFSIKDKEKYDEFIRVADEVILVSENYNRYCMFKRNKFMVDNASALVAYLREYKGGTKNTVKYAENKAINIIYI